MRTLVLLGLLAGSVLLSVGCASAKLGRNEFGYTPGYTAQEHSDIIARNWDYEGKQLVDDLDHFLLLTPASTLTTWNVR